MERLTQLVTMSFSESRNGCHDETLYASTSLPLTSSSWPLTSDITAPTSLRMTVIPPCRDAVYSADHRRTAERNEGGSNVNVDIEGASTGSSTPDDTVVTGKAVTSVATCQHLPLTRTAHHTCDDNDNKKCGRRVRPTRYATAGR